MTTAAPSPGAAPDLGRATSPPTGRAAADVPPAVTGDPGAATSGEDAHGDVARVAPALTGGRALLLAPVSGATWTAVGQTVVAATLSLVAVAVLATALSAAIGLAVVVVGLPLLVGTLQLARWYGDAERARLRAQLGVDVPAPAPAPRGWLRPRDWWRWLGDGRSWAALAHSFVALVLTWSGLALGAGLVALLLTGVGATVAGERPAAPLLLGLGLLAPWLAAVTVQLASLTTVRLGRALLGGRTRAEAERAARAAEQRAAAAEGRAEHLRETRSAAVDAADEERRRIERDLHDGAQQRLVALGVELGVARRAAVHDPAVAVAALDAAHAEVKEVLGELRDLVRGIHPAVLTDRGLDAALSALAARSPVPVEVDTAGLAPDVGPQAQAAAYFVVAEALTNVAKHAGASRAAVRATSRDDRLRVEVEDDGRGGAGTVHSGGLEGLRRRVEALEGTFELVSPAAGGTVLTVEVPCAS